MVWRLPELTPGQRGLWDAITAYMDTHGYAPTHDELLERTQCTSRSTLESRLAALASRGHIRKASNVSRGIVLLERPPA